MREISLVISFDAADNLSDVHGFVDKKAAHKWYDEHPATLSEPNRVIWTIPFEDPEFEALLDWAADAVKAEALLHKTFLQPRLAIVVGRNFLNKKGVNDEPLSD